MFAAVAILVVNVSVMQGSTPAGVIPSYPEATRLCGGHVTGAPGPNAAGAHIT
jgi:hypothetical protein